MLDVEHEGNDCQSARGWLLQVEVPPSFSERCILPVTFWKLLLTLGTCSLPWLKQKRKKNKQSEEETDKKREREGDTSTLMQRAGKRKRGSPEPAPRGAGSTATSSWCSLQPPRGTPRAWGRGRRTARGRPIVPEAKARPVHPEHCEGEEEQEVEAEEEALEEEEAPATTLPDDEEIHNREEHYQQLRRVVGVGSDADGDATPLGFSSHTLDELQALWSPLTAGELLAPVGHFLRIISQMMEEVGFLAETLSCGQIWEKRRKPGTHRPRTGGGGKEHAKWR